MRKIKVWDSQTRIFHWSLVFFSICSFVLASVTIATDAWLGFHIAAGTSVGILLLFRIFWGFAGSLHSRFSSFPLAKDELARYLNAVLKEKKTIRYTGHNPAASWVAISIIVTGTVTVLTGILLFGIEESRGILSFMHAAYFRHSDKIKFLHYLFSLFLFLTICTHISGIILENLRHKTSIHKTMITGEKYVHEDIQPLHINALVYLASFVWLALPVPAAVYVYHSINSYVPKTIALPQVYKNECGTCHMGFPPNLLPARSWQKMMTGLENHFGEDASIDNAAKEEIGNYLLKNPAESSLEEAAIKILSSIKDTDAPLRITDTTYFKLKHDKINPEVFKRESIGSKSNCVACHKWAEHGSFEDNHIKIPK